MKASQAMKASINSANNYTAMNKMAVVLAFSGEINLEDLIICF